MILRILASDWRQAEAGWTVRLAWPPGRRGALWVTGWDEATTMAARVEPGGARFTPLLRSACAAIVPGQGDLVLRAPVAADGLALGAPEGSATMAAFGPRGLQPVARPPRPAAPDAAQVARLLAADEIEALLGLLGEAILGGADRAAIEAASRDLFRHLARHPLRREPALGALVAALSA